MIYRKLDVDGDYTFGILNGDFYKNQPEAVGQAIKTRLGLIQGEWFLDNSYGTPYETEILGAGTVSKYDHAIQTVILNTQGVVNIVDYASGVDPSTRKVVVSCKVNTIYSVQILVEILGAAGKSTKAVGSGVEAGWSTGGGGTPIPFDIRITTDGSTRVTTIGDTRITVI